MTEDNALNFEDEALRDIIYECINTNNLEFLVQLISQLKKNYIELAQIATVGYYNSEWTHDQVINYVTYET